MKVSRTASCLLLLTSLCWFGLPIRSHARPLARPLTREMPLANVARPAGSGIKEIIPDKYKQNYRQWKAEFLAAETGRKQWDLFEQNLNFTLTITVSKEDRNGAGTSKYKWDDAGNLIAATISLGARIDEGYPNAIYYPVMNSLSQCKLSYGVSGDILAAAKFAHEFGHVKRMSITDGSLYRLQAQLIPAYNKILLSNGHNTNDPRLIELARQMGGTPVEIWEDREYWGEANAMLYLRDRITKESEQRALFHRILRTVELYSKNYAERFDEIAQ